MLAIRSNLIGSLILMKAVVRRMFPIKDANRAKTRTIMVTDLSTKNVRLNSWHQARLTSLKVYD